MHPFVERLQTDLAIEQLAQRFADGLERELRWCFPEGWRRWVCIALGIAVFPIVLIIAYAMIVREWPVLRIDLDSWQRAAIVLKSIYGLIFAALWCWGVWMLRETLV